MTSSPDSRRDVVVIYDLDTEGHHAGYILHLIQHFGRINASGRLVVASVPEMVAEHPDLAAEIQRTPHVSFHPVALHRPTFISGRLKLPVDALVAWRGLHQVCKEEGATHAMLMYADALLQVPIALGLKAPCPFSGIYFRPVFHYEAISPLPITKDEQRRGRRQRILLRRAMRHPDLSTLFTLDSFAVPHLNTLAQSGKARWLPDPVRAAAEASPNKRRAELKLDDDTTMLLLFGVLSSRKGVQQVLDAMRLLPADQLRSVTLCLVGPVHASAKHLITNAQAVLGNRLKVLDNFVSEADVQSYFAAADIVLAPYPRHVGMSAVIIRAAAAEKPLVASAFGLMGALVKAHRLGLAVDAREPAAIAEAILEIKQHAGTLTSTAEMKNLAQAHRTEHFAQAILERTLTPSSRN